MKKNNILTILIFAFLCTLLFSNCDDATVTSGDGLKKMEAGRELMSEQREIDAFNKIEVEGVFNVFLIQGNHESVKVESDKSILPLVLTEVKNNVLTIKLKANSSINKMKKINVYVTFVDLSELSTKGAGMLSCANKLHFNDLELDLKGAGAIHLELEANRLNIDTEIVGVLFLAGRANVVNLDHKGIGAIEAFDLKAEKLSLKSDGVGKAEVYASKELRIKAKGLGSVEYKGNPAVKNIQNEGFGKVVSVN